ncbi:MAG TPA: sulfotransferase [Acidimicrobiales bacterium]|nr:sulfotransferase [Acidimicrobiales bacterium]
MTLPNVLVIGAQKSGTSALYQLLRRHPQCEVGAVKESHFFVDASDGVFGKWDRGVDWYSSLFARDATIVADVSPSYAAWPLLAGVPERAASVVPDATIVYLVRDPVDRIVSHWRHWVWRGYERRPFAEAVLDPAASNQYVACSLYDAQLRRWLDHYPSGQVLVLHQDEVRAGARRLLERFGLTPVQDVAGSFNVSDDMRTERLQRVPSVVRDRLPRRFTSRPVPKPRPDRQLRAELRRRVDADTEAFTRRTGVDV